MVVRGKSWLHVIGFGVGRKNLLSKLEIRHTKVVIAIDFRWSLLPKMASGVENWS